MKPYGMELLIDLHNCDTSKFNRKSLRRYFKELCKLIDMTPCKLTFWDDVGVAEEEKQTAEHTKGTSAIQFILTSNITIHTLDILGCAYVNIFSCKTFDPVKAAAFTKQFFNGIIARSTVLERL